MLKKANYLYQTSPYSARSKVAIMRKLFSLTVFPTIAIRLSCQGMEL